MSIEYCCQALTNCCVSVSIEKYDWFYGMPWKKNNGFQMLWTKTGNSIRGSETVIKRCQLLFLIYTEVQVSFVSSQCYRDAAEGERQVSLLYVWVSSRYSSKPKS